MRDLNIDSMLCTRNIYIFTEITMKTPRNLKLKLKVITFRLSS